MAWVSTTYFAEGYPYSIVHNIAEAMFKEFGASLQAIGLTSLFHLPWNLKFLWGPFLDRYASKRSWLVRVEILLSILLVVLALCSQLPDVLLAASLLFVLVAFLSATHDIAIDGYYLEALDKDGQSRFVGFRIMAWRVSAFIVAGPAFILIGRFGWLVTLSVLAVLMILLTLYHLLLLPRVEREERSFTDLFRDIATPRALLIGIALAVAVAGLRALIGSRPVQQLVTGSPVLSRISTSGWIGLALLLALLLLLLLLPFLKRLLTSSDSHYALAFTDFLDQRRIAVILGFVVFLRTGESFLLKMRYAFLRDIGMTQEQFGMANMIAIGAAIVATMLGGYLISHQGLRRWIWPFIIAQNLLNLLYMLVANGYEHLIGNPEAGAPSFSFLTVVIVIENFGAGLGNAVFMVYLMRCCKRRFKAAHYAIVSALMSVSFTISGVASGFLAEAIGFTLFFGFTFLATIPAMALIPFLPYLDGTSAADLEPDPADTQEDGKDS